MLSIALKMKQKGVFVFVVFPCKTASFLEMNRPSASQEIPYLRESPHLLPCLQNIAMGLHLQPVHSCTSLHILFAKDPF